MIESYRKLDERYRAARILLESTNGQIEHLQKLAHLNGPNDICAIRYDDFHLPGKEQIGFDVFLSGIGKLIEEASLIADMCTDLKGELDEIGDILKKSKGRENQVIYYRYLQRYSQIKTAEVMGISDRQVRNIERNLKNKHKL